MMIKKLSGKTGLTEEMIYKMMGINHLYSVHYKKKNLKKVEIDFSEDKKTMERLMLISKTLKIGFDAVVTALIMELIEEKTKK